MRASANLKFSLALLVAAFVAPGALGDDGWTEPVPVMNRAKIALTYRAKLAGDFLIVEANHSKGWHTYAMDNTVRARKASGETNPESELPTRIEVSGGATVAGVWLQTAPVDKSQPEIKWYTWAFEGVTRFAVPITKNGDGDIVLTINAQSCDPASCTMVSNLKIVVPSAGGTADESEPLIAELTPVLAENTASAAS